ncbi:serine hydrolase domain-containing protein [Ensifer sp.]|jgi:CubicO group peptidase (beta-lactamase class C family)|uniref:serine hydrolase domain-containing protein n=1 Tax=Ensifer sp. TaxID=1872086 RepID=UPI002E1411C6|nr:serine hydrolase domain-containing protein [Ensifer sp.]
MLSQNVVGKTVERLFSPLVAAPDNPQPNKSVGILVGVTLAGERYYYRFGTVALNEAGVVAAKDIVFFIGSNTKVVTATLLALAARETDGPVTPYTHVSALLPSGVTVKQPHGDILLWHLATHSAGFPDGMCGPRPTFGNYPFSSENRFLETFKPAYAPGKYWVYSNQGFGLLGVLLSHAYAGGSESAAWDESYQNWPALGIGKITAPLGMSTTQVDYARVAAQVAEGYTYSDEGQSPAYRPVSPPMWDMTSAGLGAGALSSTLSDMLTFLEAEISPPEGSLGTAIRTTQQPHPRDNALSMGLGWQLGNGYLDKNGALAGYQSYMAFDPGNRLGVFVFGNTSGGTAGNVLTGTGRKLLGDLRGFAATPSTFPHPATVPQCPA